MIPTLIIFNTVPAPPLSAIYIVLSLVFDGCFIEKNKIKIILSYENKQGAGFITERPEEARVQYSVGGLFNPRLFKLDNSTRIIQLGLFNSSIKTQLNFTQVVYELNKMRLNNLG